MLIPQFTIQQADDCQSIFFKDVTCFYDAVTCKCGYSPSIPSTDLVNPAKNDITKTVITLTSPAGSAITLQKNYLPMQVAPLQITCADLALSTTTTVITTPPNDCGCGSVQVVTTTQVPASCFVDGCWSIQYDVYATEVVTTNFWNLLLPSAHPFTYPAYCTSITIDGVTYTNSSAITDEPSLVAWLNTLNAGYFTVASDIITVSSFSHTYGSITAITAQPIYHLTFSVCGSFTFPVTFHSVQINGISHSIEQTANSWDDIVALINNLGIATYSNGGASGGGQNIIQISCGAGVLSNFSFSGTCVTAVATISGTTNTFTVSQENTTTELIVGTVTQQEFLYCNIKNAIRDFKLTNLQKDCQCGDTTSICELDSDFATMLIAANNAGSCGCQCSSNYLAKAQNDLSVLQKLCQ